MQGKTRYLWVALVGIWLTQSALGIEISGQVVDHQGHSVEGAEIVVFEVDEMDREDYSKIMTSPVLSDAEGHFEITQPVHTRHYSYIVARKPGLALAWDCVNSYGVTKGRAYFLLVLEKPGVLAGRVVDSTGKPVAEAHVQAIPKTSLLSRLDQNPIYGPETWMSTQTDEQGVFTFKQFGLDVSTDFWIKALHAQSTYIFTPNYMSASGFEVDQPDIRLVLPQEQELQGFVLNPEDNTPVPNVELVLSYGGDIRTADYTFRSRRITSDDQGQFLCPGLPAGKIRIKLSDAEQVKGIWALKRMEVDFNPMNSSESIQVTLERCGTLEFTVHEKRTRRPLSDFYLRGWGEDYFFLQKPDSSGSARVHLPAGKYRYNFWHKEPYSSWEPGTQVSVEAGQSVSIPIEMNLMPRLTGQVRLPNGQNATNVLVRAQSYGDQVYTDQQGRFQIDCDNQGTELIVLDRKRKLMAYDQVEDPNDPVNLQLQPALKITGSIRDPQGNSISAARISMSITSFESRGAGEVLTDSNGHFEWLACPIEEEDFQVRLSVNVSGYVPLSSRRMTVRKIADQVYKLEPVTLNPANLSISGVIVDANDNPAPRVIMFLHGDDGTDQPDKTTATDEQGRFQFTRIGEGPLRIQLNFDSSPGGLGWLHCQAGDHGIKAIQGQTNVHEPFQSLSDTPLPDLSSLSPDLAQALQSDHPALLCFVDIELRTARHCLSQLAQQLDPLREQGFQVLIIQMSPVDLTTYQEWIENNNINIPIYPIEGDLVQKKYDWGVKSLPWLILTDKSHKVISEGSSLKEVLERM